MSTFGLRILTPDSTVYAGDVEYLSVDAADGRVGFMRGALPRTDFVKAGVIEIKTQTVSERFTCGDGIINVSADGVTVLLSHCAAESSHGETEANKVGKKTDGEGSDYKYAKAKMIASIKNLSDKKSQRD